ncbi:hypothetical protein BJ741DRAFT_663698 [Chytriomyces cf. hyalinus JEL632]|nr:hypothetical protein BJ741DRAFT_663698 [Chytriomyces cf. hyalinus JEL632]
MSQQNSAEIKDQGLAFPQLLTDICETLKAKRGMVANGVGLSDLTHSPSPYGVSYFAAEKMGDEILPTFYWYFVSTLNEDKAVNVTFLFPAMVLNESNLIFAPPHADSSFSVAGMYCQILCDEVTSAGFQAWLGSGTVLKDSQIVKGKRFKFGTGLIPGTTDHKLFTRFSRTYKASLARLPKRKIRPLPVPLPAARNYSGLIMLYNKDNEQITNLEDIADEYYKRINMERSLQYLGCS